MRDNARRVRVFVKFARVTIIRIGYEFGGGGERDSYILYCACVRSMIHVRHTYIILLNGRYTSCENHLEFSVEKMIVLRVTQQRKGRKVRNNSFSQSVIMCGGDAYKIILSFSTTVPTRYNVPPPPPYDSYVVTRGVV